MGLIQVEVLPGSTVRERGAEELRIFPKSDYEVGSCNSGCSRGNCRHKGDEHVKVQVKAVD